MSMKWLFLVHQVQTPDSRERVKVWRLTKKVGAVLYRNSVYVLPYSKERLEDFQWLAQQIRDSKGEASVFLTEASDEEENNALRELFESSVKRAYESLRKTARLIDAQARKVKDGSVSTSAVGALLRKCKSLRAEFKAIRSVDFFDSGLAEPVQAAIEEMMKRLTSAGTQPTHEEAVAIYQRKDFQGKTWGTRERIHIDRLCSGWLIRRFIDKKAKIVFAPEGKLAKQAIPFDVMGAEFGHHYDDCSFETLLKSFELQDDVGLREIAKIVHDIDLKDQKFGSEEARGIDVIVRSLSEYLRDDHKMLEAGGTLLDALYRYFSMKGRPE